MKLLRTSTFCLSLVCGLTAQGPDDPGGTTGDVRASEGLGGEGGLGIVTDQPLKNKTHFEQRASGLVEITRHSNGQVTERKVPMEEARKLRKEKRVPRIRANNLCRGTAHVSPRRLAPGQSGNLKVLITLGGQAVALPTTAFHLAMNRSPGLTFGKPVLRPASITKQKGKYLGERIYDDYLWFDVPVSVDADAKPAKIGVSGLCDIELYSGKTGAMMGDYTAEVGGFVRVGTPLPSHNLAVRAKPKKAVVGSEAMATNPGSAKVAKSSEASPAASRGAESSASGVLEASGSDGGESEEEVGADFDYGVEEAGTSMFLLAGGGALGLVLILLLFVRRR